MQNNEQHYSDLDFFSSILIPLVIALSKHCSKLSPDFLTDIDRQVISNAIKVFDRIYETTGKQPVKTVKNAIKKLQKMLNNEVFLK